MIIAKGTSIPSKYNCTVKHFAPVPFPGMKATGAFVVTGANKGIGFETVRELGKRLNLKEAAIVLCSRTLAAGDSAISSLAKEGIIADLELLDITDRRSRRNFIFSLQNKYKHVACLVNNAGIAFRPGLIKPLAEQAKATCDVNYYGTRDITIGLAPLFGNNAKVIFLTSNLENAGPPFMSRSNRDRLLSNTVTVKDIDSAVREYLQVAPTDWRQKGWPNQPYFFSKTAVIGLTAALARQAEKGTLNPDAEGIIITACYPGWCKTDMAGWEIPPLSAADGGKVVAQLVLGAGRREHGKLVVEGREIKTPSQL